MKKTKFLFYSLLILLTTSVDINSQELIDSEDEDKIDFASPGDNKADDAKDDSCNTSPHSDLLDLLNIKRLLPLSAEFLVSDIAELLPSVPST